MSRLAWRLSEGLPDEVLWLTGLNVPGSPYRINRTEILALRAQGYSSPQKIMLGDQQADVARIKAFEKAKPAPIVKSNWLRDSSRAWKNEQRRRFAERHIKRAHKWMHADLISQYYELRETKFEHVVEALFTHLNISFKKLDVKGTTGAPDYLLELTESPPLVLEVKTKLNNNFVDYNSAVEVIAAAVVHGYPEAFCVTLCHPGVDPSVPLVIASCGRLSVVESHDLLESLLRLYEGTLTQSQLWKWLATPGQALTTDLPYREFSQDL
jgi:helicase